MAKVPQLLQDFFKGRLMEGTCAQRLMEMAT
ncbi:unnamed protein product [Staurois parvus]|uniref:Uncharacterized protein n=1 Tax=Staurois parvus TaxID=386267 RepID=A0ABN9HEX4_9NEOB|nr:unnamed protein product [Staurois parvus]